MPRIPRPKTRTSHLAEALEHSQKALAALQEVDLRTTRGDLRDAVRDGREIAQALVNQCYGALQHYAHTLGDKHLSKAG
jgi:hypothetical protein